MNSKLTELLQLAENEVGYLEKSSEAYRKDTTVLDRKTDGAGKNNITKYWRDIYPSYQGNAWCNAFIIWLFVRVFGEKLAKELLCHGNSPWSFYTPTTSGYFKSKGRWSVNPQVGSVVYFQNSVRIHHIELVYAFDERYVYCIGGNTSGWLTPTMNLTEVVPNGGGVFYKCYMRTDPNIAGYGVPDWKAVETFDPADVVPVSGEVKVLSSLNIRDVPVTGGVIGTYDKGRNVTLFGKHQNWFKTDRGWISGNYVEGWVKQDGKWWYVRKGYDYPKKTVEEIDGKLYAFDGDGWLITADRIDADGSIK